MGIVYRAFSEVHGHTVAVKVLLVRGSEDQGNRNAVSRFHNEFAFLAGLDHPNIVRIFTKGTTKDGRPYFAMQLRRGETLAACLQKEKETAPPSPLRHPRAAASLLETLARAMHYAHGQRVIHRDLKPANILLATDAAGR